MRSLKIIILLTVLTFVSGYWACSRTPQKQYLSKNMFSKALKEMLVIRYLKIEEAQKAVLIKGVLQKYHITKKEFTETEAHYAKEPRFWEDVFKKITRDLQKENRRKKKKTKK